MSRTVSRTRGLVARGMVLFGIVALVGSIGCASQMAASQERTLAAAGFKMKFAKTPEQIAKAESMLQRTLTPVPGPNGDNRFVYADAKYCKCNWVGDEAAYDRYQKMQVTQQIAQNEEAASMNWGMWGPWY